MRRRPGPPPHLPGFEFVEVLGTGGSADVSRYREIGLGRDVAVKVLLGHGMAHSGFEAEASVMAQLSNHPSIVSIFQAGVTPDGRAFLVMEYCPPPHLGVRVRMRPLTPAKALEITIQLAGAVETAHRMGILHRDIKPANVLSTQFGRAALTDFGISTASVAAESGGGMSVPWSPPEQLVEGAPMSPASDVWSLAATMWTSLVGHSPFHEARGPNDAMAMAGRVRGRPLPPAGRRDVPETLERTLSTAMAKRPGDRFESALAFARALQAVQVELRLPMTSIDVIDQYGAGFVPGPDGGTRATTFSPMVDPPPVPPALAQASGPANVEQAWDTPSSAPPPPWPGGSDHGDETPAGVAPGGNGPAEGWQGQHPLPASALPGQSVRTVPVPESGDTDHHTDHRTDHHTDHGRKRRGVPVLVWLLLVLVLVGLGVGIGAGLAAVAAAENPRQPVVTAPHVAVSVPDARGTSDRDEPILEGNR